MAVWMTVEVAMIGLGSWLQPLYFAAGPLMIGLAGLLQGLSRTSYIRAADSTRPE
jgi:hypothetical protein